MEALVSLERWLKTYPHLHAVPVSEGETSVALLLLRETDHQRLYPCGKEDVSARLNTFTKRLRVAADAELTWLEHKKFSARISMGLRLTACTKRSVRVRLQARSPCSARGRPIFAP